jgi:hypothetical protein
MPRSTLETIKNIDPIVMAAISEHLGDISYLPNGIKTRIDETYKAFFTAYLNIGRIEGISENEAIDKIASLDQDLIDYMQHFFSDYQDLYHDFINLNRHAKELLQIDRIRHPKKFDEKVDDLIAGRKQFNDDFVFNQLRSNQNLGEKRVKN